DAQIGFAGGRSVGRLGETATLTLDAVDNVSDTARLVAEADLANVSTTTRVTLRYDAEIERFTATFPVNRLPAQGQALGVLSVRDQAGNVALTNFTVLTNGSPAQIGAVVVDAATSGATVSWTTPNATRGRVDYGIGPQLGLRTDVPSDYVQNHSFTLSALLPDTTYYAKAVAITQAGIETTTATFTFHTGPALKVDPP